MPPIVAQDSLRTFLIRVFEQEGIPAQHAATAAEGLLYANLCGFDTHGLANLKRIYLTRLKEGRIDPHAVPQIVQDTAATAVVDGNRGLGFVTASYAMDLAITKAREFGVGVVTVRGSSHCGSLGYYATRALQCGMIGIAATNLGAQAIARPLHGSRKMLGTNPLCAAVPAGHNPPFILDMSTTVVSTGKVRAAAKRGERIPNGWLSDDNGLPVNDPTAYDAGTGHLQFLGGNLATGGNKGYGLAILVDILSGCLSGAAVGPSPAKLLTAESDGEDDENIGHFFLALNVAAFQPHTQFAGAMDQMLDSLLQCPPVVPERPVLFPGCAEAAGRALRETEGIPLDPADYDLLCTIAAEYGLPMPTGDTTEKADQGENR